MSTLADLGITKRQSSQWQQLAAVPEALFEAALCVCGHGAAPVWRIVAEQ